MESATLTNRTLEIDGMTGDDCVKKVTGVLAGIKNVTTHAVKIGTAHIGANVAGASDACSAIDTAGFKARERVGQNPGSPAPAPTAPSTPAACGAPAAKTPAATVSTQEKPVVRNV